MPDLKVAEAVTVRGITPYLLVRDANAASEFYQKAFGAREVARAAGDDGVRLIHCHLVINGDSLMLNDPMPEYGYPLVAPEGYTLHLQVDDVDAWWKRAVDAGCEIKMPLDLQFWGDRYGAVVDPFGVRWSIGMTPKT